MKKLVFVAAAIAAGVTSFAVNAANSDRTNSYLDAAPAVAAPAKSAGGKRSTAVSKATHAGQKGGKARNAKRDVGKTMISAHKSNRRTGAEARRAKPASAVSRTNRTRGQAVHASRKRVVIDTKASALTDLSQVPPDLVAKPAVQYASMVSRYASDYGVPSELAHAVISVESNYRADARGSAGEIGLMQIKPATARMMGYSGSSNGLFNPETNIKYGMKYLGLAHKLGGGATCGTILRYNAGHAAKRMNPVSSAYCTKVKRFLAGV